MCGTGCWEGPEREKPGTQALGYHNSIISLLGAIANELRLRAPLTCLYCGGGGEHYPVSPCAKNRISEVPLPTFLLTMPFSFFARENRRIQKVSPVKVRRASQLFSLTVPGSTLARPQTSLFANVLLFSCPQSLTNFWKSERKLQTVSPLCPAPQQGGLCPPLLPAIIGSKQRKMMLCLLCECYGPVCCGARGCVCCFACLQPGASRGRTLSPSSILFLFYL